jgi:hypothetical protein
MNSEVQRTRDLRLLQLWVKVKAHLNYREGLQEDDREEVGKDNE